MMLGSLKFKVINMLDIFIYTFVTDGYITEWYTSSIINYVISYYYIIFFFIVHIALIDCNFLK